MNKTINISIYALLHLAIFFGTAIAYQSCKGEKKEVVTDINAQLEDFVDENDGESLLGDDETSYDDGAEVMTDDATTAADMESSSTPSHSAESSTSRQTPTPSSISARTSTVGDYMIIAGNYLVETNAQEMVRKLKNAGYSSAEYAVFDLSQYRTVIAGRYSSRSRANEVSTQLKNQGFDNYVLMSKE